MKIYKISGETSIEKVPTGDIGGTAWDMMPTYLDRALYRGYWQTAKVPQMLYAARGILGELGNEYISEDYIKEKLSIIKTWADKLASQNIHPDDHPEKAQIEDAQAILNAKQTIEKIVTKTAQEIATKRLMEGIVSGNVKVILENINYLSRWINSVENGKQNVGSEPKY